MLPRNYLDVIIKWRLAFVYWVSPGRKTQSRDIVEFLILVAY